MEIEVIVGAVTVTVSDCTTVPRVAVMELVPAAMPETSPPTLTVAAAVDEELQVARNVTSRVVPSL